MLRPRDTPTRERRALNQAVAARATPMAPAAATAGSTPLWVEDAQDPEWTASIAELRQRLERSTGT